ITVHEFVAQAWRGDEVEVTVRCSGGTYIRALARDLGRAAGSAAHLTALRRLTSGPFTVVEACSANALKAGAAVVLPPLAAVPSLPVVRVDGDSVRHVRQGRDVGDGGLFPGAPVAALVDETGTLLAIAQRNGDWWHPRTVLGDA
ncbi:MAG TPA: hypothetical protein VJO52_12110, partial [Gemmatimonadaceae bacterium]|nr:hypothetical protein [Gemmatimonadaceae bacterium]